MQQTLGLHHYTHSLVGTELYATADSPKHTRNRILDEIGATKWDGTARVEELFITAFGADDTTYTRMVGRYWTISAIARLIRAGCQVDTMLVLEGDQGIGKSKALEILGGVGYAALQQKLDNKDFLVTAHTAWIVDMVELGAMKYADMEQIKGLITTRTDSYRAPYGRASVDRPRRFIMVGTTNSDDYLRDDTGNRRFWPMKCNGEINYAWLTENRAQLWAEALHRYMANEQWWEDYNAPTVQATREMQQSRVPDDPWQDLLAAILTNRTAMRKVTYCGAQHYFMAGVELLHALNVGPNDMPKYSRRLRAAMRKMIEWREHHYASKTQSITLATGGTAMSIRGYIHVGSVPPSAGNVTQLPQPSKF
jgi:predicted P-loop ATPase